MKYATVALNTVNVISIVMFNVFAILMIKVPSHATVLYIEPSHLDIEMGSYITSDTNVNTNVDACEDDYNTKIGDLQLDDQEVQHGTTVVTNRV